MRRSFPDVCHPFSVSKFSVQWSSDGQPRSQMSSRREGESSTVHLISESSSGKPDHTEQAGASEEPAHAEDQAPAKPGSPARESGGSPHPDRMSEMSDVRTVEDAQPGEGQTKEGQPDQIMDQPREPEKQEGQPSEQQPVITFLKLVCSLNLTQGQVRAKFRGERFKKKQK